MEFFTHPQYRTHALPIYRELLCASKATSAEAQTNIPLKLLMLYDCAINITAHNVLFEDAFNTKLEFPGAIFRRANPANTLPEPGAERVVDIDGRVVASGGFLTHCNPPFGDVYMSVAESERGKGYDSYVIQEVKRVCYEAGRILAARCNADNLASRLTLQKARFTPCARLLVGDVKP